MLKYICLIFYYLLAQYLPNGYMPILGKPSRWFRYILCRSIFKKCGYNVNIERRAYFGKGFNIKIGDNSGIGPHAHIPDDIIIGNNVMMAENCYVLSKNHNFQDLSKPMNIQGYVKKPTIIEDDVWIGRDVLMTPGRTIKSGSIIAARCVLCKDFPEYSIIGGNPSCLIKSRVIL